MAVLLWLFAIGAGISNPLQSGANSELMKRVDAPIVSAFTVYAVGSICLLACIPLFGFPAKSAAGKFAGIPWWAFVGGICNVAFLLASLMITKKMGSATFTTVVVISAVITSVLLDHFGLMGFKPRHITGLRALGCVLAAASVVLIARF